MHSLSAPSPGKIRKRKAGSGGGCRNIALTTRAARATRILRDTHNYADFTERQEAERDYKP